MSETRLSETERRVLDAIDIDGMVEFLCELIAIPSLCGQERPAQERVAAWMKRSGLAVDLWDLDFELLSGHTAFSMEVDRRDGLGVVGTVGEGRGGRTLIFNGHVDVVPPGEESSWSSPPYEGRIRDGQVIGRGAVDMKGGLCCALFAAKALREADVQLRGKLLIESVIGEEDGGVGTLAASLRGFRGDGAVIMEPTALRIGAASAGALSFRVTIPGLAAHAAVREEGVSAIEKFVPIYLALQALEGERNRAVDEPLYARYRLPYALNVGTVRAGNWPSSVAESLAFEGRLGVALGESPAAARESFEATVARAAAEDAWLHDHPPKVEWRGGQFEPARIPSDHPIVTTVGGSLRDAAGREARVEGMTYGSDMRLLVNIAQTPAVLFGPGDVRRAHRPDEAVAIEELVVAARTLALTALRFCGHQRS